MPDYPAEVKIAPAEPAPGTCDRFEEDDYEMWHALFNAEPVLFENHGEIQVENDDSTHNKSITNDDDVATKTPAQNVSATKNYTTSSSPSTLVEARGYDDKAEGDDKIDNDNEIMEHSAPPPESIDFTSAPRPKNSSVVKGIGKGQENMDEKDAYKNQENANVILQAPAQEITHAPSTFGICRVGSSCRTDDDKREENSGVDEEENIMAIVKKNKYDEFGNEAREDAKDKEDGVDSYLVNKTNYLILNIESTKVNTTNGFIFSKCDPDNDRSTTNIFTN